MVHKGLRLLSNLFLLLIVCQLRLGQSKLNDLEQEYILHPSSAGSRASLRVFTSSAHVAGTEGDYRMATFMADSMTAAGIPSVEIHAPDTLLSYPIDSSLRMLNVETRETVFKAKLAEDVLESDLTTDTWWRNHTFHGYSPSGAVTAPLVYANKGRPEDFRVLEEAGVAVEGKIVLVRYGGCFRGLKVMNAEARGAAAVLIYSDPADDGYAIGPTYPDGGWRPETGVQRGSVSYNSLCAGDPTRTQSVLEGMGGPEEVCGYAEHELIPRIPSMPLSWGDAKPLLEALGGPDVPDEFKGALDIPYKFGPTKEGLTVEFKVNNEFTVGPVWNVIGIIPGKLWNPSTSTTTSSPTSTTTTTKRRGNWAGKLGGISVEEEGEDGEMDRPIILGNHRDAWVFGAVDPNSGSATLIEVARGLGALVKTGWQPERTIILCSWSGEEFGLLGSTAWGESNMEWLSRQAVAYLNVDEAVGGPNLEISATGSLGTLIRQVLSDIDDTGRGPGVKLIDNWEGKLKKLGSGSDYTVFLHYLGIACVDMAFRASIEHDYGVYHSIYDSFTWMDTYGDPGFVYHKIAAQLWGVMALRLAEAATLPFDHVEQADDFAASLKSLEDDVGLGLGSGLSSLLQQQQQQQRHEGGGIEEEVTHDVSGNGEAGSIISRLTEAKENADGSEEGGGGQGEGGEGGGGDEESEGGSDDGDEDEDGSDDGEGAGSDSSIRVASVSTVSRGQIDLSPLQHAIAVFRAVAVEVQALAASLQSPLPPPSSPFTSLSWPSLMTSLRGKRDAPKADREFVGKEKTQTPVNYDQQQQQQQQQQQHRPSVDLQAVCAAARHGVGGGGGGGGGVSLSSSAPSSPSSPLVASSPLAELELPAAVAYLVGTSMVDAATAEATQQEREGRGDRGEDLREAGGNDDAAGAFDMAQQQQQQQQHTDVIAVTGLDNLNDRLAFTERRFLSQDGLPTRKWFKHVIQAPGIYLGYKAVEYPGIRESIDAGDFDLAQQQIEVAAACVMRAACYLGGGDDV